MKEKLDVNVSIKIEYIKRILDIAFKKYVGVLSVDDIAQLIVQLGCEQVEKLKDEDIKKLV